MRLPAPTLAALLLFAVGLAGTAGVADGRSTPTCKLRGSKTFLKNRSALVIRRIETRDGLRGMAYYGCHRRTKKRVFVGITGQYDPDDVFVKLRGRFVAVNYTSADRADTAYGVLRLWDLRRPKRLQRVRDVDATDIEIGRRGQLVWIGNRPTDLGEEEPPLSVRDVYGKRRRTLATGNISPTSLRIRGSVIYWTQDGSERSAPL